MAIHAVRRIVWYKLAVFVCFSLALCLHFLILSENVNKVINSYKRDQNQGTNSIEVFLVFYNKNYKKNKAIKVRERRDSRGRHDQGTIECVLCRIYSLAETQGRSTYTPSLDQFSLLQFSTCVASLEATLSHSIREPILLRRPYLQSLVQPSLVQFRLVPVRRPHWR